MVPTGSWTNLSASGTGPANGGAAMMLLSDGSILVQNGSNPPPSASIVKLSPQANTGSYVDGSWSDIADMNEARLFFSTAMLPSGKIFAVGGEYPKFSNTAEIYDPVANTWSLVDPAPTPPTAVFLNGSVTGASNSTPITITTGSTGQLKNGMQVTITGVGGNTAANGTFTVAGVTGTTFQLVGSSGNGAYTSGGNWTAPPIPQFGDDPTVVLGDGQVLAGYFNGTTTYRFNPSAPSGSQWTTTAGGKLHGDQSDEETWVKLPDGSILSYDVFASAGGTFQAQRYIPSQDKWVDASKLDATNPPSILSTKNEGFELGPAFLQPDGNVIYFGTNGNTAIYNPTTDTWSAGPAEPQQGGKNLVGTDDPGAMLPNGKILVALSPQGGLDSKGNYTFPAQSYVYEYDPTDQSWTDVTPGGLGSVNAFALNMVLLPTGQVLLSQEKAGFQVYTEDPATGPKDAWRPTISSIVDSGGGVYTLTGTQLNGISEGSTYGDDNESVTNYPIVRFKDSGGNVYYGRTFNWSSTGVATGSTPVTTQFTLPAGHALSDFTTITVIANGIPSADVPFHINPTVTPPSDQTAVEGAAKSFTLGSFTDPDNGPWHVDVDWGDGTAHTTFDTASTGSLGTQAHTFAEEGSDVVTVTVTDGTGLSGSATFKVSVSDPAVTPSPVAVDAVEGADTGPVAVATFTDPGGPEPVGDYSATIDWGDGTPTTTGVISVSGGVFTVKGNHTYAEESAADHPGSAPYQITVTISHESAPFAVAHSTATVSDPAVAGTGGFNVVAVEGQPTGLQTVATFTDPGGAEPLSDYSAMIDWGDGTAPSPGIIRFSGGVFTVQGSHTYAVGLGLPDDFGNSFCDAGAPFYHKAITVSLSHESAPLTTVTSTATISLTPGTAHLAGGNLIVVATTGDDHVVVTPVGNSGAVRVNLNSTDLGSFTLGPGGRIIVAAMSGNDDVQVAGGVTLPTVLYGGPGDDRLNGGNGPNILIGCAGDDELIGGNSTDLLVGGDGSDRLNGNAGDDILVAADIVDPTTLAEDVVFSHLISALNGGPITADDDGYVDYLQGAAGIDVFYYHLIAGPSQDIVLGQAEVKHNT